VLRVTLDTNIYISGLNYRGNPFRLLELARSGELLAIVSDSILDEVERILHEKFNWPPDRAKQARRDILDFALHVTPLGDST
jgi:putative PIN family toxin of toxin-antitoxin system